MKKNPMSNQNGMQDVLPSLRSVGCIPCDFHRIKYTSTSRNFMKKENAAPQQKNQLKLNLQLELSDHRKDSLLRLTKKGSGFVDKWKQKHRRSVQEHYFERRKSIEEIPDIRKRLIEIHEKFRVTKYVSPHKAQKLNPKPHFSDRKLSPIRNNPKNFQSASKSAAELRKQYSLTLFKKWPTTQSQHKKSKSNNLKESKGLQEMPAGWQINEEEQWVQNLHNNDNHDNNP